MTRKPELLAPAGDLEKLQTAVRFGADAVYVGAGPYSLRTQQTAFDLEALEQGLTFAHQHKVKVYLAMNIFAFDDDLAEMSKYLEQAKKLGIDAVIISDPGLISLVQKERIKIHLSTQANTLNTAAVKFWRERGIERVVLGRELSLSQVKKIKENVPGMEIELFVHGAMCMSYSGRCLLSKHLTGKSANRGECTQPCRWEYRLKEVTRPDEEFLIKEDARGTYVMNSKDLCLIEHIPELIKAGVDSFKIEGRMKSPYYVALVTKIYRQALDSTNYNTDWKKELENVSHRNYTTGFYLGEDDAENAGRGAYVRNYTFVGVIKNYDPKTQELEIKVRNYFAVGDELEIIDPKVEAVRNFKVQNIRQDDNAIISEAHNELQVFVPADFPVSQDSLLRRKV
ncbi:hypothetical protein A3J44_04355 [candidate division WOR-1 bacterium RIFCSPHIGHO2_02_FULL_45_12]|nr:MAG: hypothetical protein A3J44_04355 [candidate division WOR-1 bacterium RIFCSPHIGHO2_02_FULL_45_12]